MDHPEIDDRYRIVHSGSPPESADAEAKPSPTPSGGMPSISDPIDGGEAMESLPPTTIAPRRRRPSSSKAETNRVLSSKQPTSRLLEPSSRGADGHPKSVNHSIDAEASREPQVTGEPAKDRVLPNVPLPRSSGDLLLLIRETHYQRNDFIKAKGDLTRRIKAICRRAVGHSTFAPAAECKVKLAEANALYEAIEAGSGGGSAWGAVFMTVHMRDCRDGIDVAAKQIEKRLKALSAQLHVADFVERTPGFGLIGLAQIVGEAGDLAAYANPAKLWKRMGLGLISSGERQRCFTDKAKAIEAGYNPRRRSTMFVIGDSLIKKAGPYRELYLARKAYEVAKATASGLRVLPSAKIKKAEASTCMSEGHVHLRSQRYVEKRLLRDLWRAWRGGGEPEQADAAPADAAVERELEAA